MDKSLKIRHLTREDIQISKLYVKGPHLVIRKYKLKLQMLYHYRIA